MPRRFVEPSRTINATVRRQWPIACRVERRPIWRLSTFAVPVGMRNVSVPASASTGALARMVPSPPRMMTVSAPHSMSCSACQRPERSTLVVMLRWCAPAFCSSGTRSAYARNVAGCLGLSMIPTVIRLAGEADRSPVPTRLANGVPVLSNSFIVGRVCVLRRRPGGFC